MKRKELYNYVREEIINELTEADLDKTSGTVVMKKGSNPSDIKKMTSQGIDVELKEMASYKFFRVADREKFNTLKDIYANTIDARILDSIEASGEKGITQADLAAELGIASSLINPILKKFGSTNAITLPSSEKPVKEPEVEEPEVEEPETEEPESDSISDEDMEPIDEPSAADIADAEKEVGSIDTPTVDTEKIEAANKAADIIKKLSFKIENMKKGPERERKMAALKQYVKNNRGTVLKGYKISDLTNGLVS